MKTETQPVEAPIDPKIAHPLGKLRGTIKRYVTIEGVLAAVLFVVSWFWLALLIDYGVFKLFAWDWALDAPKTLRMIALVVAVAALLALIITKIFIRLTREFSNEALALVLERRYPKILGDRLISAVQLADLEKAASYGYSVDMIKKTIDDVRQKVDTIPVNDVFAWKRLYRGAILFVFLTIGLVGITGVAVCAATKSSPKTFWNDFTDVSGILVERDVMMMNTPWPRRAYLEVVNFPGEEVRVGRDVPNPRVRIAAYGYVLADSKAPMGWRPLTWADVPKLLPGEQVPELPLQQIRDARFAVDYGPFLYGTAHPFTAPTLPTDVTHVPGKPEEWAVDRVEQVFTQNPEVKKMLLGFNPDDEQYKESPPPEPMNPAIAKDLADITAVLGKLTEKAADPSMSRTMRKLKIPDEVELRYWGLKSSVEMKLRAEPNNEFSGVLSDLKESVKFFARGENFDTTTKLFTLVPPPMLSDLTRDEYQPAYLYHKAPFVDASKLPNDQKPYLADPTQLKGVKHVFKDQKISLTGDRSRFDIPTGTEFTLTGTADKDLQEALIMPKPGKYPGIEADNTNPESIPIKINDDKRTFSFEFSAKNKNQILTQTEFDLFLRDTDNVTSKRLIQVVVEEDRAPEVDVVVDVIRKVGGTYVCTPQALIPFTKDSKIRDDKGLNRAEFVYSYYMVEPQAITNKRGEYAAWLWNNIPVVPNLGNPLFRSAMLIGNYPLMRASQSVTESHVPIPGFADEFKKQLRTSEEIKGLLNGPRPATGESLIVKDVDFRSALDEVKLAEDIDAKACFDMKKILVGLKRASDTEIQNNYLLTLTVMAVDTNVESGLPGVAQNRETMVFRLVSDAELLTEIAREEATIADKLDDAIRRTAEVDNKYRSMTARFSGLNNPDAFTAEITRANEISELFGKVRDILGEINADYGRILLEYKANRLNPKLIADTDNKIVKRLNEIVITDIPQTEESYGVVHGAIGSSRVPSPDTTFAAQQKLTSLLFKLREIRGGIGAGLDFKKLVEAGEAILKGLRFTAQYLVEWQRAEGILVQFINVRTPSAPVTIVAGQEATIRVPVIVGALYNGNLTLKLEASDEKAFENLPKEIKLKDDDTEFVLKIKAGFNKGNHTIRITPDKGPARDLKVVVR